MLPDDAENRAKRITIKYEALRELIIGEDAPYLLRTVPGKYTTDNNQMRLTLYTIMDVLWKPRREMDTENLFQE